MGLFSLTQELAIDLGTANTIIINNGKIVVDEPSIVALDQHTGKPMAIGKKAPCATRPSTREAEKYT